MTTLDLVTAKTSVPATQAATDGIDHPVISLRNVSKVYRLYPSPKEQLLDQSGLAKLRFWRDAPSYNEFHALRDVTFDVQRGERVGIIGRNGAGKTTLLKLVTQNFSPTTGLIEVNGSVQALMQLGIGFHPEFSGMNNIRSALNYNGIFGAELDAAVADVVDFVELGDFLHQPLKTYSMGMNARLQFAVATAIRPDIVIIDEVLSAGDAYFAAKSAVRMQRLADSGCTILLVSHSWQQIQQYCKRAVWLKDGAVFMDGNAVDVLAAYDVHINQETARHQLKTKRMAEKARRLAAGEDVDAEEEAAKPADSTDDHSVDIGPDYAAVDWIADRIREQEGITAGDIDEFQVKLEDGRRAYRIEGLPGIRICNLALFVDGKRTNQARTGDHVDLEMTIRVEATGQYGCSYWIHLFGIDGRRLCRIESPTDFFNGEKGERRKVRIDMGKLLLGSGDYLMSFSIFDLLNNASTLDIDKSRFDMLSRSYQMQVLHANDSDPPVIHYPAKWRCGDAAEGTPSRITSVI